MDNLSFFIDCYRRERQLKVVNSKKRPIKPELKSRTAEVEKVLNSQLSLKRETSSSW